MKIHDLALSAIGLRSLDADDDPTLSAIDALLVDAELLRYTLDNSDGEELDVVRMAENAVERFLDRLQVVRKLHTESLPKLKSGAEPFDVLQEISRLTSLLEEDAHNIIDMDVIDGFDRLVGKGFASIGAVPIDCASGGGWAPPPRKGEATQ